jgi:nucleotide-binding universal stress UspA family protein
MKVKNTWIKLGLRQMKKIMQIKTEIISSINTAEGIVDYAQEKNLELIVIGTRGRSGLNTYMLLLK